MSIILSISKSWCQFVFKWSILNCLTTLLNTDYQKLSISCILMHSKPSGLFQPPPHPPVQARGIYPPFLFKLMFRKKVIFSEGKIDFESFQIFFAGKYKVFFQWVFLRGLQNMENHRILLLLQNVL